MQSNRRWVFFAIMILVFIQQYFMETLRISF